MCVCRYSLQGAGVISCPERNYTLVVVDSEGTRATQTSQATGDVVNIVVRDLRENTRYRYHVVATNRFGNSDPSTTVEFLGELCRNHARRVSSKGGGGGAQGKLPPQTAQLPPQTDPTSPPRYCQ